MSSSRQFLAFEVVQTSAMDCGPACLTSLARGHGVKVDYGRLREACQTGLDGTSIDTLEEIANSLGLETEQQIFATSDLLRPEADAFPAILVTKIGAGALHFVVAWRRVGGWIQVMDPAKGRVWLRPDAVLRQLHAHTQRLPGSDWRSFAESGPFIAVLRARLDELGLGETGRALLASALDDPRWQPLAALDATARFVEMLVESGAVQAGAEARAVMPALLERAMAEADAVDVTTVPAQFWSVRPIPGTENVGWTGAIALRVLSSKPVRNLSALPPLVRSSLESKEASPFQFVWQLLRPGAFTTFALALVGVVLSVLGVAAQAFAIRSLVTMDQSLLLPRQRLFGIGVYALLLAVLASADLVCTLVLRRLGRHFEARLWAAFLRKLPRLPERYLQSRLTSDMAERLQSSQQLRQLPDFVTRVLRTLLRLALAVTAIGVVDLHSIPIATLAFVIAWALPLAFQPAITERDMRVRGHNGALSRFLLDALLGLIPARTHGAERAIRREHEGLLAEWVRGARAALHMSLVLQALQGLTNTTLLVWLISSYVHRNGFTAGGALVVLYWGAQLPLVAREILALSREYPSLRNIAVRVVEPIGTPEEVVVGADVDPSLNLSLVQRAPSRGGVTLELHDVSVIAGGHTILDQVSIEIPAGQHVAIVGRSGAGKSSLVSLLLGWHRPATGALLVDGMPLTAESLELLRLDTAWVDPGIQLWNDSLLENVRYGAARQPSAARIGSVLTQAELLSVIERLPEGLQTRLGESGRLLSGGEGQRVRLARALIRNTARLVLLDEPFRGLERPRRRELLWRARAIWSKATMICVSHDVGDTEAFDRVLVVDGGRVVEDGTPGELRARAGSLYGHLLAQEEMVRTVVLGGRKWRRVLLADGRTMEVFEDEAAA